MKLIAVTGTDGKTTTCNLVHHILQNSGFKTGIISTIGAKIEDKLLPIPPHMTSPDPNLTQKILKKMTDQKVTHVIIEVTAHAIDQFRYFGNRFDIAAITNTSHEHLDYFSTKIRYLQTKAKLFRNIPIAIINQDDDSYPYILVNKPKKIISFSCRSSNATYFASKISIDHEQLRFSINELPIVTDSPYKYQVNNILVAYAICRELKVSDSSFQKAIINFPFVKGRREAVDNQYQIKTIIDFAHTPAALDQTLSSLKNKTKGKLLVIFGATGGRDKTKRPIMGQIVQKYADIAFITADDTRNEKVKDINSQIISGFDHQKATKLQPSSTLNQKSGFVYYDIPNRQDAFNLAVLLAHPNDTIIACGKGHETSILHGKTEYPWSERDAFETAFKFKQNHEP